MDNYIWWLTFATGFMVGGAFFSLLWVYLDIRRTNKQNKHYAPPAQPPLKEN